MKYLLILPVFFAVDSTFTDNKQVPIIFHKNYDITCIGLEKLHPFDTAKYGKIYNFLKSKFKLKDPQFYKPKLVTDVELLTVHSLEYINNLNYSSNIAQIAEVPAISYVPNFILQNILLTPMKYATGGTILGCDLAMQYKWAINLSGGYHHAKKASGEGFCFFADIPIATYKFLNKNPKYKVMVVDLDAHQGNGCESIFKDDPRIAVFDIYNGQIYPNDFEVKKYIKYNYPVKRHIKDLEYLSLLNAGLPKALDSFKPNLIIYNAGTDIFENDPLGAMKVSQKGIIERDYQVFKMAFERSIPILMVLSGGYSKESSDIICKSIENIIKKFNLYKN